MKEEVIVFGLGNDFHRFKDSIKKKYNIVGYTDTKGDGINRNKDIEPFYPLDRALHLSNVCFLICSRKYRDDIEEILISSKIKKERIRYLESVISFEIISKWRSMCIPTPGSYEYKKKIFVIGDSHVGFFTGYEYLNLSPLIDGYERINGCSERIEAFKVFHLGPALAYNLNKYGTKTAAREKVEELIQMGLLPSKDACILFAFGEIDIRVHVVKEAKRNSKSVKEVIDAVVNNYLEFARLFSKNNKVILWGPIASGYGDDKQYPTYGSMNERNKATEYFNNKLDEVCKNEKNMWHISIFKYMVDKNYKTIKSYLCDPVHLSQNAWKCAKNEFEKIGISINCDYMERKIITRVHRPEGL